MPISDEVIELAPVKKTKKTLLFMIIGMGVLFALAIAFLVMYLVKPSVTEDTNHVKDISVNSTELFSGVIDGEEVLCASIGNEYTVYSTVTVDNESSTNVSWTWDPALIEVKEQNSEAGAYLKFIPKIGNHGKTAKITVRAASQVEEYKTIEFTIINQGAEDIRVTQYSMGGNVRKIEGDSIANDLEITVPYYTMAQSSNNKPVQVKFEQLSKQNSTTGEYSKLTSVEIEKDKFTNAVSVTTASEEISIIESSVSPEGFSFTATKITAADKFAEIKIQANVNNDTDCEVITKTIKVKVDSNVALGYVDTMYFFNKPIVDAEFMSKVLVSGNNANIDNVKLNTEIAKDTTKTLKVFRKNDKNSANFEFVLPYSHNVTYNDIFKHLMLNPANIQYGNGAIKENWYSDIEVTSSNPKLLEVTRPNGEVRLLPKALSGTSDGKAECYLTFKDSKQGSAGADLVIPVRIIAQTTAAELAVGSAKTNGEIFNVDVNAAYNGKYEVAVTFNFCMPSSVKTDTLLEKQYLNNEYILDFNKDEMDVKIKGSSALLKSGERYAVSEYAYAQGQGSTEARTNHRATITFEVTVKKDDTGNAVFRLIKDGSYLFGAQENKGPGQYDKAFNLSASFQITESASKAWVKGKDSDEKLEALNIVTDNGKYAGDYVRQSDTEAFLYVQNQAQGDVLEMVAPDNLSKLVGADKTYITLDNISVTARTGFTYNRDDKTLKFLGSESVSRDDVAGIVNFDVFNVGGTKIASLSLKVYIIYAVETIKPTESLSTYYDGRTNASITLAAGDVKVKYSSIEGNKDFEYSDVNLYYGNGVVIDGENKVKNGKIYTFKHEGKELYEFDVDNLKITQLTDIFEYSYEKGINFGDIELEFLLKDTDEYLGKHYGQAFTGGSKMKLKFVRMSDDIALFYNNDYSDASEIEYKEYRQDEKVFNAFNAEANQGVESNLYACSIININVKDAENHSQLTRIYIERDAKGHIAPVEQAYFSIPLQIKNNLIDDSCKPAALQDRYYSITYAAPSITEPSITYEPAMTAFYANGAGKKSLLFTINNQVRNISSIGIYRDQACTENDRVTVDDLLFGGFNGANRYTNKIYIKVEYAAHQLSHTQLESVKLTLPSYLEIADMTAVSGISGSNVYTLSCNGGVGDSLFAPIPCTVRLIADAEITDSKQIKAVPAGHDKENNKVTCDVQVFAGLESVSVDGKAVTAGNKITCPIDIDLKDPAQPKQISLDFVYSAINGEGYSLPFDHKNAKLVIGELPNVSGLTFVPDFRGDRSTLTVIANGASTVDQKVVLTFTDTFNGASVNNLFTVELDITVTMDIYKLAFADGINAEVTVTGQTVGDDIGKQTLEIGVVYNKDGVAPTKSYIDGATVVGVYIDDQPYNNGGDIYIVKSSDGNNTYTLHVANNIDTTKKYYLNLGYANVKAEADHRIPIKINTQTCYIAYAEDNDIKPKNGAASIVVKSTSDRFKLAVNVLNDGSHEIESGKTVTYLLYGQDGITAASGVAIDNSGYITVSDPEDITGTINYIARYVETKTGKVYELKAEIAYSIAPSAVDLTIDPACALYNAATKTITLYTDGGPNYTSVDLHTVMKATNAFGVDYAAGDVSFAVTGDRNIAIDGSIIRPNTSTGAVVPITITATYAGKTVPNTQYKIAVVPIAAVRFENAQGDIDMTKGGASVTAIPTINTYAGLNYSYSLDESGVGSFAITDSDDDNKTIALAAGTTAEKGKAYTFIATLTYTFTGSEPFAMVGTFRTKADYTVSVSGEHKPQFKLSDGNDIPTYDSGSGNTKHAIMSGASYSLVVTDDLGVPVTYRAVTTNGVINIGAFGVNKTASVTLNNNASGSFTVTVYAKIGGSEFSNTQTYYFVYGDNIGVKLYMSENGGEYTEFAKSEQSIDHTTTPYKFKYEITGLPQEATVSLTVNGEAVTEDTTASTGGVRYVIITATKPAVLSIGGVVQIGSRKIYLADKTVELTATAPDFVLGSATDSVKPAGTVSLTVSAADNFIGDRSVSYSIVSGGEYAAINANGVLTAAKNVTADQTVIVRATVTVSNGVYAGTYTVDKSIKVEGVALPAISWKDGAKREVSVGSHTYSENDRVFNGAVGNYTYSNIQYTISANSATLTKGSDYTLNGSVLTVYDTAKTKAGGNISLTVTAAVKDDVHNGESVSDTIVVRVLPTMSSTVGTISLGNAQNTYDLNGAYKSVFAPNTSSGTGFVNVGDEYSVVSLTVSNTDDFTTDGAKLIVNKNLSSATSVTVTAKVLISSGAYAGTVVTGSKTVNIVVPTPAGKTAVWNNNGYSSFTLGKADVLGALNIGGAVISAIQVAPTGDNAPFVGVTGNGTNAPVVQIDRNSNVYFTAADPGNLSIPVNYTVTLDNGIMYYGNATYTVPSVRVDITAKNGENDVARDGTVYINPDEKLIVMLSANNGFTVNVTNVDIKVDGGSGDAYLTAEGGGNGVQFTAKTVTSDKTLVVTLTLSVAGKQTDYKFNVTVVAQQSGAQFTADNTDNINIAKGDSATVSSKWSKQNYSYYGYASAITVTAPNNLSTYFSRLQLNNVDISGGLDRSEAGWSYASNNRLNISNGFTLTMYIKTGSAIDLTTITVKLTAHTSNRGGYAIEITVPYKVRVIDTVTVTLDKNAGDDAVFDCADSVQAEYRSTPQPYSRFLPTPKRTGYTFMGWYDYPDVRANEQGNNYVNKNVEKTEPHTLYAHWKIKEYTIKFNVDGTVTTRDDKAVYGQNFGTLPPPDEKTGYDFAGWKYDGDVVTANTRVGDYAVDTITLVAEWTEKYLAVTLDPNGGKINNSTARLTVRVQEGSKFDLHTIITATQGGYRFDGWYKGNDKQTVSITVTEDIELTAHWSQLYTVSFNSNDGSAVTQTLLLANGDKYGTLPEPTREGYRFDGWYTAAGEGGSEVTSEKTFEMSADQTLVAKWVKLYKVTFDLNYEGASSDTIDPITCEEGQAYGDLPAPTRDGYSFDGWYIAAGEDSIKITSADLFISSTDITLYAHWNSDSSGT